MDENSSRRTSLTSCDMSVIDQSCALDTEAKNCETNDFMGPMDDVLALVQNAYNKKIKISAKDMQLVQQRVHEMKNKIINKLILTEEKKVTKEANKTATYDCDFQLVNNNSAWPPLQGTTATNTSHQGKMYSFVIVKSSNEKKFETSEMRSMESKVNTGSLYAGADTVHDIASVDTKYPSRQPQPWRRQPWTTTTKAGRFFD